MHSPLQILKTASRKKFPACTLASSGNRPASRAGARVWLRRRKSCVGVICYADHLGTPRAITKATDNQKVWEWQNVDPFGANLPNENPSALGNFAFNLRFPGQYADQETGTFYNYFRDYDPSTGRYIQSDPIGLQGGLNTFAYAYDSPLRCFDPKGLDAFGFEPPNPSKATTVCRYGYPVIQIPKLKGIQDKCWGDCAYLHELVHLDDYTRWGFGSRCRGKPDGAIITVDVTLGRDSEIRGYEVEIQCLQAKFAGLSKCDQCYSPVETRLNDVTSTRDQLGYRR